MRHGSIHITPPPPPILPHCVQLLQYYKLIDVEALQCVAHIRVGLAIVVIVVDGSIVTPYSAPALGGLC
jgi:hypothetical protein